MPGILKTLEKLARFLELLGSGALSEVAANHDELGLQFVDPAFHTLDQPFVMGAEMQVREMDEASHC
jgi:hypothetical protein